MQQRRSGGPRGSHFVHSCALRHEEATGAVYCKAFLHQLFNLLDLKLEIIEGRLDCCEGRVRFRHSASNFLGNLNEFSIGLVDDHFQIVLGL